MPIRTIPLVTNQYYHIFNRGINKQPIFLGMRDHKRALKLLEFYSYENLSTKFSYFLSLSKIEKRKFWRRLKRENKRLVEIISFVFLPNHFHFLIKQAKDNGISEFMSLFQNSLTRYFNTRYNKFGPILQGQFKAVKIEDEKQLVHLSRYIHLNPYSSAVIKKLSELENYPWSSLPEYFGTKSTQICSKEIVLANFKSSKKYRKFVFDQANYQRELQKIKHLMIEK